MTSLSVSRRFSHLLGACMLAVLPAMAVTAPVASAQGTVVIVYDQAKVMRDSKAGKDIVAKLKAMGESTKTQLKPEGDSLDTERKALEARTANMTEQAVLADATLRGQLEGFGRKANTYAQKVQKSGQELSLTERKAWADFFTALEPVLKEVMAEKGASIMLDASNAVLVNPSADVSALVISKLDARTPTISVVRQSLPTQ